MKSISFILGVLILVMALKPCADGGCSDETAATEICDSSQENHKDEHTDSCAMFCVCNCCGVLVVHQKPTMYTLHSKNEITTKLNSHYESNYRFDILFVIWQPPQLLS